MTPNTPNGTFCEPFVEGICGLFDVLFIHIAVVITKYICEVVIGVPAVVAVGPVLVVVSNQHKRQRVEY